MRLSDTVLAEMEDRGGEDKAGVAKGYAFDQMLQIADATAGISTASAMMQIFIQTG